MYMIRLLSVASAYAVVLLEIYSGVIDGPMWWILPGGLFLSLLTALIMFGNELTGSDNQSRGAFSTFLLWSAIVVASFGASWLSNHFGRNVLPELVAQRVPGAREGDFSIPETQAPPTPAPAIEAPADGAQAPEPETPVMDAPPVDAPPADPSQESAPALPEDAAAPGEPGSIVGDAPTPGLGEVAEETAPEGQAGEEASVVSPTP